MTHYLAEKLEDNVLSKKTAAWAKREGVKFYRVNEKFSSIQYLVQSKHLSTQITRKEIQQAIGMAEKLQVRTPRCIRSKYP